MGQRKLIFLKVNNKMPITYLETHQPFRIIGIDPGIDTLGLTVLDLDLESQTAVVTLSVTFRGAHMEKDYPLIVEHQSTRLARLMAHEDNLLNVFNTYRPHAIACEGPYMSRFPMAYAALTECVTAIRRAVVRYDSFMSLLVYDPSNIKKSVGAKATSGDKSAMTKAVFRMVEDPQHPLSAGINLNLLDEHAIDSIAIAWLCSQHILSDMRGETLYVKKN